MSRKKQSDVVVEKIRTRIQFLRNKKLQNQNETVALFNGYLAALNDIETELISENAFKSPEKLEPAVA